MEINEAVHAVDHAVHQDDRWRFVALLVIGLVTCGSTCDFRSTLPLDKVQKHKFNRRRHCSRYQSTLMRHRFETQTFHLVVRLFDELRQEL
jgi:hypothetical protein